MSKNSTGKSGEANRAAEPMIPFQAKVRPDVRTRLEELAKERGLSMNDVAGMCIMSGIGIVARKLKEIHEPEHQDQLA